MTATLEVIALDEHDAERAEAGGADRLEIVGTMRDDGLSPPPELVGRIRRATALPIRVMLRLRAGFATDADELGELRALAAAYRELGADGFVFGFLDAHGEIDVAAVGAICAGNPVPWTFHRAVDGCADFDRAWSVLVELGCDQVLTAGSPHGVALDVLLARTERTPASRARILAGGGLATVHVGPLAAAGIRAFHIGRAARPEGAWSEHVSPSHVRGWRALVDRHVADQKP